MCEWRNGHAQVYIPEKNYIFCIGGSYAPKTCEYYEVAEDEWGSGPELTLGIQAGTGCYSGTHVYYFGGLTREDDEDADNVYRPVTYMERLNFAEFKQWEVVDVKCEGKTPLNSMWVGAGMINESQMLIFGGMLTEKAEGGEGAGDTEDAFFFDVNTHTFSDATPMKREIRMDNTDEVKLINGKLYAIGEVDFEIMLSIYNVDE